MADFTPQQTLFSLSLLSNLGAGFVGSEDELETQLSGAINTQLQALQAHLGPWSVVWGPAIFQEDVGSVRADNTMFVAQSGADPSAYVVSIAGTNFYSAFDWVFEDVFVAQQVPWAFGTPSDLSPALADGTNRGLSIVQKLQPGASLPGGATLLQSFLENLPPGKVKITVVGHSLGGALSPATALWLLDTQKDWDPTGRATLFCLPSAGPTPGNQDFATYYDRSPLGATTTRIHNSLDVVPHAFVTSDLKQVPTLYQPDIDPDVLVRTLVFLAVRGSQQGDYAHIKSTDPELPGAFNPNLPAVTDPFPDFKKFVAQMAYQHVEAYLQLMGIGTLTDLLVAVRAAALKGVQVILPALEKKLLRQLAMLKLKGVSV